MIQYITRLVIDTPLTKKAEGEKNRTGTPEESSQIQYGGVPNPILASLQHTSAWNPGDYEKSPPLGAAH